MQAKVYASIVELWHEGNCVARHERCYRRQQQILDLEHYLDVLSRKPGALAWSRPLEQQRKAGLWPESFDVIWQSLMERHGNRRAPGRRSTAETGNRWPVPAERSDRDRAGDRLYGCRSGAASFLLTGSDRAPCEAIDIGSLERYQRPLPVMNEYDLLLMAGGQR